MPPYPGSAGGGGVYQVGGPVQQIPLSQAFGSSTPTSYQGTGSAGGVYGGSGGAAPAAGGPMLSNTAQVNPDMAGFLEQYKAKLNATLGQSRTNPNLQTQVDRLGQRLSTDTTQHAIGRATGAIRDQASAQQAALKTQMARRGISGSGVGDQLAGNIDARSQRAQAGAASDISLGRERDLDALTLGGQGIMSAPGQFSMARDAADLGAISGGVSAANPAAQLQLGQQNLGLQTWQAGQNQQGSAQDRAFAQWMALQRMYGGNQFGGGPNG